MVSKCLTLSGRRGQGRILGEWDLAPDCASRWMATAVGKADGACTMCQTWRLMMHADMELIRNSIKDTTEC